MIDGHQADVQAAAASMTPNQGGRGATERAPGSAFTLCFGSVVQSFCMLLYSGDLRPTTVQ